jgi:uncharacterized protein
MVEKKMKRSMDLDVVRDYILKCSRSTSFYLGSDSERYKKNGIWVADFTTVVVCHIDSCHGAKVFGQIETARDYDQRKDKPSMRLLGEVHRVAELFDTLKDVLQDRRVEVHLDLNSKKIHASNAVVAEALGYIKGTCGIDAHLKPNAFAASFCADRFSEVC